MRLLVKGSEMFVLTFWITVLYWKFHFRKMLDVKGLYKMRNIS